MTIVTDGAGRGAGAGPLGREALESESGCVKCKGGNCAAKVGPVVEYANGRAGLAGGAGGAGKTFLAGLRWWRRCEVPLAGRQRRRQWRSARRAR
jgi:hypothetical protein